ncbi:MAG TPA: sensor histidine kinase [Jiangellaceae bacterium]|nr:sensor histidine kinase [Jiangellaceae bacterium]
MGRRTIIVAAAALTMGVGVAWVMFANEVRTASVLDVILVLVVGWSFIGAGLLAWQLKPGNSIGTAMVVTGFLRFAAALDQSQNLLLFAGGHALEVAYLAGVIYIVLAFPQGRLEDTFHRWLFGLAIFAVGPLDVARLVFGGHDPDDCVGCPSALVIEVVNAPGVVRVLELALFGLGAVVAASAFAVLVRRWRRASPRLRLAIAPVLWVGAASFVAVFLMVANHFLEEPAGDVPHVLLDVVTASVAFAFLVGLGRTRLARSAVADLVIELGNTSGPGKLRGALARALRDPSVAIAYWLPESNRFVDADGQPVALPDDNGERSVTIVQRKDHIIAALVHDPALREDEQLVESVCAAAGLAMENERLQAELRARLQELSASRTRIVEATQAERRRIERDLHDGSQQRLVSVAMTLGLADSKLASDPDGAQTFLREARTGLSQALEDLRELSSGIYPGILTERGLAPALDELAARCHLPVDLVVWLPERLPDGVETAAYFVVSELLTNVAKHAPASNVRVRVEVADGGVVIQVRDNGPGGADPSGGSGLRGLRDRVEALGGRFTLESPPGAGTVVEAAIPCE